jgi:predicted dehydrogenase
MVFGESNNVIGNITVEVISRPKAVRDFRVIGSKGEIVFSVDTNSVKFINTDMEDWKVFSFDYGTIEDGYINPEEPYINEIKDFIEAIRNKENGINSFPNTLEDDYKILQTLYKLENISDSSNDLSK